MQPCLFEHFYSEGHFGFLDDVTITFIDKTDTMDIDKCEHIWRHGFQWVKYNNIYNNGSRG